MRLILGLALATVMGLVTGANARPDDDKIDAKKLVGKWATKEGAPEKFTVEFTKDGKFKFEGPITMEGTYKLDGNKLTIKGTVNGNEETMTRTITKLTDAEVSSKDENGGKEDTLVRVKEKAKDKK